MRKIRFAIVGAGAIAPIHIKAIRSCLGAEVIAVYGRSLAKVQKAAEEYGCEGFTDYQAMLARPDIDAVALCIPSGLHTKAGIEAAKAGKHVIVEKPIDISLEQADALIAACQTAGVKLGVIFQRRYSQGAKELKKLIDEEKLGKLLFGGCYIKIYRDQAYYDSAAWRGTWEADGGGVLMNQGIHYIDLLQYFMGQPTQLTAVCKTLGHDIAVEDTAAAALEFKSGAMGVIEGTTCAYPGLFSRIEIYGSEGTAILQNEVLSEVYLKSGEEYRASTINAEQGVNVDDSLFSEQYEDFIKAVQTGCEPAVNGREGRKALEIILAVYKAAFTGDKIKLPLLDSRFLGDIMKQGGFKQK